MTEEVEVIPPPPPVVQVQTVIKTLGPEAIERLAQSLPSARVNLSEFRRALTKKMCLYDMSLAEITQLMSIALTESEFHTLERTVNTSEFKRSSKDELREGVLRILKDIIWPKIDWARVTSCVQKKEEILPVSHCIQWNSQQFRECFRL